LLGPPQLGCEGNSTGEESWRMAIFSDQLKQVLRRLSRARMFTAITLITLAVGVGANTVIFSIVEGVLLKPLNYPHAEQLIGVWHRAPGIGLREVNMAPFVYFIDREQNTTLQDIGVYSGDSLRFAGRTGNCPALLRLLAPEIRRECRGPWSHPHCGRKAA
jgi:hypothetical protein